MPVAVDRDGAVVNLYGIGVCPTTVFSDAGGTVRGTKLGNLTEDELRGHVRKLVKRLSVPSPTLERGWVDSELAEEFPGLAVCTCASRRARAKRRTRCRQQMRELAGRITGGQGHAHAPGPGALGLPGVLAPGRHRPGHRPHARSS